jgi:hypothetical protein
LIWTYQRFQNSIHLIFYYMFVLLMTQEPSNELVQSRCMSEFKRYCILTNKLCLWHRIWKIQD